MERGWDRPRDCARTLRERDGKDKPFAEHKNNDDNKYSRDGDIPDDSAPPAESIVRLHLESQHTCALTLRASYSQRARASYSKCHPLRV
jgi:hypothetical protein